MTMYIAEIAWTYGEFDNEPPNNLADAAQYLACDILNWSRTDPLSPLSCDMVVYSELLGRMQSPPHWVFDKYRRLRYSRVAMMFVPAWSEPVTSL